MDLKMVENGKIMISRKAIENLSNEEKKVIKEERKTTDKKWTAIFAEKDRVNFDKSQKTLRDQIDRTKENYDRKSKQAMDTSKIAKNTKETNTDKTLKWTGVFGVIASIIAAVYSILAYYKE